MVRELKIVMDIDQLSHRLAVRLLANVPVRCPYQPIGRHSGARSGHLRRAKVDGIAEDGCEKSVLIFRSLPRAKMGEVAAISSPAVDLQQQVGDFDAWQVRIGPPRCRLRFIRYLGGDGRDRQLAFFEGYTFKSICVQQGVDVQQSRLEKLKSLPQAGIAIGL